MAHEKMSNIPARVVSGDDIGPRVFDSTGGGGFHDRSNRRETDGRSAWCTSLRFSRWTH